MSENTAAEAGASEITEQHNELPPEIIEEATQLGWADKDKWKGRPEDWIDAKTFVEKGKAVMPLLKANNNRLQGELSREREARLRLEEQFRTTQATLKMLEEHRETDIKAQVEERIAGIKAGIAEASADGDHAKVADLTAQLVQEQLTLNEKPPAKEAPAASSAVSISPETQAWFEQNQDFRNNPRIAALGTAVAQELRAKGETAVGVAFLEKVKKEVYETLGSGARGTSKALPGNGGGGRSSSSAGGGGKSYADLPADAREACAKLESRFVGANKAYKTLAEWQAAYTKKYFEQE